MTCPPGEHTIVLKSEYSVETETDSAIVEKNTQEKVCEDCGKTLEQIKEIQPQSDALTLLDESEQRTTLEDEDTIIMEDNSENPTSTKQKSEETGFEEGEQSDDAYIMSTNSNHTESDAVSEESVPVHKYEQPLVCITCCYHVDGSETPHYPGDSCPECNSSYLRELEVDDN